MRKIVFVFVLLCCTHLMFFGQLSMGMHGNINLPISDFKDLSDFGQGLGISSSVKISNRISISSMYDFNQFHSILFDKFYSHDISLMALYYLKNNNMKILPFISNGFGMHIEKMNKTVIMPDGNNNEGSFGKESFGVLLMAGLDNRTMFNDLLWRLYASCKYYFNNTSSIIYFGVGLGIRYEF